MLPLHGLNSIKARSRLVAWLLCLCGVGLLIAGTLLTFTRAQALVRVISDTGNNGYLMLTAPTQDFLWERVQPGKPTYWVLDTQLRGASAGKLSLEVQTFGHTKTLSKYSVAVKTCSVAYQTGRDVYTVPTCSAVENIVLPETSFTEFTELSAKIFQLDDLTASQPQHYSVQLKQVDTERLLTSDHAPFRVGVGFHASGTVDQGSPQLLDHRNATLSTTGSDFFAVGVLAAGALCVAAGLFTKSRAQR